MIRFLKKIIVLIFIKVYDNRIKYWVQEHKKGILEQSFQKIGKCVNLGTPNHITNPKYISIGDNFNSFANLRLEAIDKYLGENFNPSIIIGDNVSIGSNFHIGCIDFVKIGNNALIASNVYISDHSHGKSTRDELTLSPEQRKLYSKGGVEIKENVWIGENVCILPGVVIGNNSIIGANSVVTKSVPNYSVAIGVPAKIIKTQSDIQKYD